MKLEHYEDKNDMRDKIEVTVKRFKRTARGFKCTGEVTCLWRTEDCDEQFIPLIKLIQLIPPDFTGPLDLLVDGFPEGQRVQIAWTCLKCTKHHVFRWLPEEAAPGPVVMECPKCGAETSGRMLKGGQFAVDFKEEL
jgi:hypothetical protein